MQLRQSSGYVRIKRIKMNVSIWFYLDKIFMRPLKGRKCLFAGLSFSLKMVHFWYFLVENTVKEKRYNNLAWAVRFSALTSMIVVGLVGENAHVHI